MSIRAVIVIAVFGFILAGSLYVALNNQDVLGNSILFYGEHDVRVWSAILWSFFIGFALAFGLATVRTSQLALVRFKGARGVRQRERVEKLYSEGLQAMLAERGDRAEERFREVLARHPDHVEALLSCGEVMRDGGRPREAADLHRRASEAAPGDMRPLLQLAADWRADDDPAAARKALEKAISLNPKESIRARRELRQLLVVEERWRDALEAHQAIETAQSGDDLDQERRVGFGIRFELGRAHRADGNAKEAARELRAILKQDPGFIPASLELGDVLAVDGAEADAIKEWRRGFEATQSPLFLERLEGHLLEREQPAEIISILRSFVEADSLVALLHLGKLYLRLEMIDEAEEVLQAIEGRAVESDVLRYYSAKIDERRGRLKEAAATYRGLIRDSGILDLVYRCTGCGAVPTSWLARCERCCEWGTIDADLRSAVEVSHQVVAAERPLWSPAG